MSEKKPSSWRRLDNAAKIFPSTSEKTDTRVFRFSCELTEPVDPETLQKAADKAIKDFPHFLSVMKKGWFWYYLESCDLPLIVHEENRAPCSQLYYPGQKNLLIDISYYRCRINLEIYHVLSDGTGAIQFLKTLVCSYLTMLHGDEWEKRPIIDYDASRTERSADSFQKYYSKVKGEKRKRVRRAYNIKGEKRETEDLRMIEGITSVKAAIEAAHSYNTTLTVYLTAVFIEAIREEMTVRKEKYPIVLMVPVNLRNYFSSETATNFFGMIAVKYDFKTQPDDFSSIIEAVSETFKTELTKERLSVRMNELAALEHNPFVRIAPIGFKNICLKAARHIKDLGETAVVSNIGRVKMPEQLLPYIRMFDVFVSTLKIQLQLCSFEDKLALCFSSAFTSSDIERRFFRRLAAHGLNIEIRCSDIDELPEAEQLSEEELQPEETADIPEDNSDETSEES